MVPKEKIIKKLWVFFQQKQKVSFHTYNHIPSLFYFSTKIIWGQNLKIWYKMRTHNYNITDNSAKHLVVLICYNMLCLRSVQVYQYNYMYYLIYVFIAKILLTLLSNDCLVENFWRLACTNTHTHTLHKWPLSVLDRLVVCYKNIIYLSSKKEGKNILKYSVTPILEAYFGNTLKPVINMYFMVTNFWISCLLFFSQVYYINSEYITSISLDKNIYYNMKINAHNVKHKFSITFC